MVAAFSNQLKVTYQFIVKREKNDCLAHIAFQSEQKTNNGRLGGD